MGFRKLAFAGALTGALIIGWSISSWATNPVDSYYPFDSVAVIPWPIDLQMVSGTDYDLADHGDLNGDGLPDIVAVQSGQAVFMLSPGNYEAMHESTLPGTVADLAIARNDGGVSLLFTAGPLGLREHTFEVATSTFATPAVLEAGWSSVTKLRAYSDPVGVITLCGVDSDGLTVRLMNYIPGVGVGLNTSFTVASPVIDLVIVRESGSTVPNVALMREDGVTFHDSQAPTPALSPIIRSAHPLGSVCAFPATPGADSDITAWITPSPDLQRYLLLLIDTSGVVYGTIGLDLPPHVAQPEASLKFVGLRSGDVDGDGYTDLLLSAVGSGNDFVLWNKATPANEAPVFLVGPGNYAMVDIASGLSETVVGVDKTIGMLADFDLDGQIDYVRPIDAAGGIYVRELMPPSGWQGTPSQVTLSGTYPSPEYEIKSTAGELRLTVELPAEPMVDATHIQAILWRHLATDIVGSPVQGTAYTNHAYRLALAVDGSVAPEQQIAIDIPESDAPGDFGATYYYVELRMVRIEDEADLETLAERGGPASIALHVGTDLPGWDSFMINGLARDGDPIPLTIIEDGETPAGGALVGAVAPLVRLPRFTEADLPKPGAITTVKDAVIPPGT